MHQLTLTPPARILIPTRIIIGPGALAEIKALAKGFDRVAVLFDEGVRPIAVPVTDSIAGSLAIPVKSGDASKSLSQVDRIVSAMLDGGCTRKTLVIAVGGGMLTDLGGFVASIFMRGVPCVFVPTTLLGMVDAAIGGKTAVNAGSRKNMIGTVTHPSHVIIGTELLKTLPEPQLREGLAEMIKIAAIIDSPFFEWLEDQVPAFLKRDGEIVDEAVTRAVRAKITVVEADEHDRDVRLLLNFGHTVGHAVEALSGYSISHGQAVSIGVAAEVKLAGFPDAKRIMNLFALAGLPLAIPSSMKSADLWKLMQSDKKNEKGEVRIAVPKRLGEGVVLTVTQKQFQSLFA